MPSIEIRTLGQFADTPVPGVNFHQIGDRSARVPLPFRFMLGRVPAAILRGYFDNQGLSRVGVYAARDLSLAAEFLLMRGNAVFRCPEMNIYAPHIESVLSDANFRISELTRRRIPGKCAFLAGPGYRIYGHWLIDHLPRLTLLHEMGLDIFELKYLLPNTIPKFAVEWLRLLGISPDQFVIFDPKAEILEPEELLLPTILHNGSRVSPVFKTTVDLFKNWLQRHHGPLRSDGPHRRLFISRPAASQNRRMVNRERIEELARQAGFAIVQPEQLPLIDQVRLFAGAAVLVGEYGSGLHGSIFSEPGTVVCALRGNGLRLGFIQSGLGHVLRHPTGYLFGETDDADPWQSFVLEEEMFDFCLRRILSRAPFHD